MYCKLKPLLFLPLFLFIVSTAHAALLCPMQVGEIREFSRTDNTGYSWTTEMRVLEEVTRDSQNYFHIRMWNYNDNGDISDHYVRSTEDAIYEWGSAGESIALQCGPVGTTWSRGHDVVEIMPSENVTVPYGGPYLAVVNRKYNNSGTPDDFTDDSPYWYEYIVPGLGIVKEVDYWNDRPPMIQELVQIRTLLWPMQTGEIREFSRTDNTGYSWIVELEVLEEVTRDSQNYFHVRRWNYNDNGDIIDLYIRSTEDTIYAWGSSGESILLQSGLVGTTWTVGQEVAEIMPPENVTVPYGGPYLAVVNRLYDNSGTPDDFTDDSPYWYEYIVPGLGIVKEVDYWNDRPPMIQELVQIHNDVSMKLPAGWSMISLPVVPESPLLSDVFPEAVVVYGFDENVGYVRVPEDQTLEVGKGYWILLDEARTYTLTGQSIQSYTIPIDADGWLMIGGCTEPAKASVNTGNISALYKFTQEFGYQRVLESERLERGQGYWILVNDTTPEATISVETVD